MNKQLEQKVVSEVVRLLINTCKQEGVDYLSLSKEEQLAMLVIFQLGVGFVEDYGRELINE